MRKQLGTEKFVVFVFFWICSWLPPQESAIAASAEQQAEELRRLDQLRRQLDEGIRRKKEENQRIDKVIIDWNQCKNWIAVYSLVSTGAGTCNQSWLQRKGSVKATKEMQLCKEELHMLPEGDETIKNATAWGKNTFINSVWRLGAEGACDKLDKLLRRDD